MRKALRHEYPLRGGIGFGSFEHQTSGSSVQGDGQIWSAASFWGGAIVSAFQAECGVARGLRVLIHPDAMNQPDPDGTVEAATSVLPANERSATVAKPGLFRNCRNP